MLWRILIHVLAHFAAHDLITKPLVESACIFVELMDIQLDRSSAFGDSPLMGCLYESAPYPTAATFGRHADVINTGIPPGDEDRYWRCVPDSGVNEPDELPVRFRDKQTDIFIREQSPIVFLFSNWACWLLKYVWEVVTMQSVDFVEQGA